jgi:hypothetical protein
MHVTRDCDIRAVLLRHLAEEFSDSENDFIVQEFRCNGSRIDVSVINGSLHGYEIKSDSDSVLRLPKQIEDYSGVFDYVTLVCGRSLLEAARQLVPPWWGITAAALEDSSVALTQIRATKHNPSQRPEALARMMWKAEALHCLRLHGHKGISSKHSAQQVWKEASSKLDVKTLADAARSAIKAREGSGFARQSIPDGDSYTIESIALQSHYSENLAWLLSQLSPDRPH